MLCRQRAWTDFRRLPQRKTRGRFSRNLDSIVEEAVELYAARVGNFSL